MKTVEIVPVGKRVLIKPLEALKVIPGTNIIIPDSAIKKVYRGTVIGIGQLVTEINVGDVVQYPDYITPMEMEHNNQPHLLITEGDILAKIIEV